MEDNVKSEMDKYICCYEKLASDVLLSPLDPAYSVRFADLRDFMHNTENDILLDIGSSQGIFLSSIKAKLKIAFDISFVFLKESGSELNPVRGNAEFLPFKDNTFDTVVASDILEHVFYPDLVIREIHRVLVPGGRFYMVIPWKEDISVYDKFKGKYDYCHLRTFDGEIIKIMLTKNGFDGKMRLQGSLPKLPGVWRIYFVSPWIYRQICKRIRPVHMMVEARA